MTYNIIWTPRALDTYTSISLDILAEFGVASAKKFEKKVDQLLDLLNARPTIFAFSEEFPLFRKVVVAKQTTLYYEIDGNKVVLLTFWEVAKDQDELGKEFQ